MNNPNIVKLQDYALNFQADSAFGGLSDISDLAELQKAMFAGNITGRDTENQGSTGAEVLKVESLENTLTVLTETMQDVKLWKAVPKKPAFNTVEEYNQLISYGQEGNSFNDEGELPDESDNEYARKSALVKFMGTTRSVSHPAQLVTTMVSSLMQEQQEKGTLKLMRDANKAIINGDANVVPQEFDGLYKLQKDAFTTLADWYNSESVIDMKGKALTEEAIQDAALTIIENNGVGDSMWFPPQVISQFVQRFNTFKLIQPLTPAQTPGQAGQDINKFTGPFGQVSLDWDKFMKVHTKSKTTISVATNTKAPVAPVVDPTTPKAAVTDVTTQFGTAFADDYYYAVTSFNRHGESALSVLATGGAPDALLTIAATEIAELKWTAGVGSAVAATGYKIYRSQLGEASATAAGAKFFPLFEVSIAEHAAGFNGGAALLVWDLNYQIANTESTFMIDKADEVWRMKQLAPLMKMDLPPLGPASRFMILLYTTLILGAPLKFVKFINVGVDKT